MSGGLWSANLPLAVHLEPKGTLPRPNIGHTMYTHNKSLVTILVTEASRNGDKETLQFGRTKKEES